MLFKIRYSNKTVNICYFRLGSTLYSCNEIKDLQQHNLVIFMVLYGNRFKQILQKNTAVKTYFMRIYLTYSVLIERKCYIIYCEIYFSVPSHWYRIDQNLKE